MAEHQRDSNFPYVVPAGPAADPILGRMRPAFAGLPILSGLFFATLVIWALFELRQALNRRAGATSMDRGSLAVVRLSAVAGALLAAVLVRVTATAFPATLAVFAVGLLLIWSGIALRVWCFQTLGRYFTFTVMTSPDQRVVDSGPYRLLRHPSYAAILLILAGIGLTYGNWLSLAALVVLPLAGFVNRIRIEESALSATLGNAYTTYASRRRRLIPFVW